jgi:hypothetical protein
MTARVTARLTAAVAAAVFGIFGGTLLAADNAAAPAKPPAEAPAKTLPDKVSPADQVQFQQKTVEAQMQELQERMFHLADLTRTAEPDSSTRLLMALRKAREQLIIEQMRDCVEKIGNADLAHATEEQQQVINKLNELKKLLTTTDLDMQMKLEELKKLNEAITKLDAGIKEEKREQKQNEANAKANKPVDPKAVAEARAMPGEQKDQTQNRHATEAVSQSMKDLGGEAAKAGETLGAATQNMSLAEGHLGAGKPNEAATQQQKAAESMAKARAALDAQKQKLLDELDKQVRQQVVANLQEMLDRQKSVRGASEAAAIKTSTEVGAADRELKLRVRQLGPAEVAIVRICDETRELIEETEFSVALPPALTDLHDGMQSVADRLGKGTADAPVVSDEKKIESDLADLLDTFKQLAGQPSDDPSNCRGCKGNTNKLLAELRTLRIVQLRVNAETDAADKARAGSTEIPPELKDRVALAHQRQQQVSSALEHIEAELAGGQ